MDIEKDRPFVPEVLRTLSDDELVKRLDRPVAHPKIYKSVHDEIARRADIVTQDEKARRERREIEALGYESQQVDIGWSADGKSTLALWFSGIALVIAALDALL